MTAGISTTSPQSTLGKHFGCAVVYHVNERFPGESFWSSWIIQFTKLLELRYSKKVANRPSVQEISQLISGPSQAVHPLGNEPITVMPLQLLYLVIREATFLLWYHWDINFHWRNILLLRKSQKSSIACSKFRQKYWFYFMMSAIPSHNQKQCIFTNNRASLSEQ